VRSQTTENSAAATLMQLRHNPNRSAFSISMILAIREMSTSHLRSRRANQLLFRFLSLPIGKPLHYRLLCRIGANFVHLTTFAAKTVPPPVPPASILATLFAARLGSIFFRSLIDHENDVGLAVRSTQLLTQNVNRFRLTDRRLKYMRCCYFPPRPCAASSINRGSKFRCRPKMSMVYVFRWNGKFAVIHENIPAERSAPR